MSLSRVSVPSFQIAPPEEGDAALAAGIAALVDLLINRVLIKLGHSMWSNAALLELELNQLLAGDHTTDYLLGGVVAFAVGWCSLFALNRLVRAGRLWVFAPYVAAVAMGAFFFL